MGVSLNNTDDIGRDIRYLGLHGTSHSMCKVSPRSSLMSRSERRLQHPAGHWHVVRDVSAITSVTDAPASSSLSSRMSMEMSYQTWPHTSVTQYGVFAETSTATQSRTSTDVKYDMAPWQESENRTLWTTSTETFGIVFRNIPNSRCRRRPTCFVRRHDGCLSKHPWRHRARHQWLGIARNVSLDVRGVSAVICDVALRTWAATSRRTFARCSDVSAMTSVSDAPASSSLSTTMSMEMSHQTWPHTSVPQYGVLAETSTATRSRTSTDVKDDMAPWQQSQNRTLWTTSTETIRIVFRNIGEWRGLRRPTCFFKRHDGYLSKHPWRHRARHQWPVIAQNVSLDVRGVSAVICDVALRTWAVTSRRTFARCSWCLRSDIRNRRARVFIIVFDDVHRDVPSDMTAYIRPAVWRLCGDVHCDTVQDIYRRQRWHGTVTAVTEPDIVDNVYRNNRNRLPEHRRIAWSKTSDMLL